jgi:hypothetical protein
MPNIITTDEPATLSSPDFDTVSGCAGLDRKVRRVEKPWHNNPMTI